MVDCSRHDPKPNGRRIGVGLRRRTAGCLHPGLLGGPDLNESPHADAD